MNYKILVGVRLSEDSIGSGCLIDVFAEKIADEGCTPPATRSDDLGDRSAGSEKVSGEAATQPVPREEPDAHLMSGLLDEGEELGDVDVAEERSCRSPEGGDVIIDLCTKAADTAEERGLLSADAPATNDGAALSILSSPKMDRDTVLLDLDV